MEYSEKNLSGGTILRVGKHILPYSELHFCEEFMMSVLAISVQSIKSLVDYSRTIPTTGNIKYASCQYSITEPILTEPRRKLPVNGIS